MKTIAVIEKEISKAVNWGWLAEFLFQLLLNSLNSKTWANFLMQNKEWICKFCTKT
jgi:hypothetical protein